MATAVMLAPVLTHLLLISVAPVTAAADAVPANLTVVPGTFPLSGAVAATVTFVGAIPKGSTVLCKIASLNGLPLTQHVVRGGYRGPSYAEVPATVTSANTVSCTPPAVIVAGAAMLSIGVNVTDGGSVAWSAEAPILYEMVVDAVVGRRPYLAGETQGTLLVESAAHLRGETMHLSATLDTPATISWPNLSISSLTGSDIVQLPFGSQLPANVTADITIVMTVGTAVHATVRRRFVRLSPLPAGATAVPTALDHTTKGVLVGGEPFLGIGWYVAPSSAEGNVNLFSGLGINQIMPYALKETPTIAHNATRLVRYLDEAEAAGVKILWPMQQFGWTGNPACDPLSPSFDKSRPKSCNYTEQISDPEWVAGVTANVSFVMHHPALLGYYICDDCCPVNDNFHNVGLQARLYQLIKSIDPYHIITGAVQCSITWPWTDVPSNPSLPSLPAVSGLPEQPALQLSLDYFLVENCERSLPLCLFLSLSLCLSVSVAAWLAHSVAMYLRRRVGHQPPGRRRGATRQPQRCHMQLQRAVGARRRFTGRV